MRIPDDTRGNRRVLMFVALVLASIGAWAWFGPVLLRRHVFAEVTAPTARDWTVEWTRADDGTRHGAYVELDDHQSRVVEITVEPREDAPDQPYEFWLYSLKTDADTKYNLVKLTDHGRAKGWVPNEHGPGILYVGPGPGTLRIPVDTGVIAVGYGKTPRTGKVTVRFRGEVVTLPTGGAGGSEIAVIPGDLRRPPSGTLTRRLPVYDTGEVTFACAASPGDTLAITRARLTFAVANRWVFSRGATLEPVEDIERVDETTWRVTGARPTVRFIVDHAAGPVAFAAGSLAMFGVLVVVCAGLYGVIRLVPPVLRCRGTPTVVIALLVLTVHTLVAVFVPTLITSDGMDYMDAADGLANGKGFANFPDYKAPGLSILIAAAMKVSNHFLDTFAWMMALMAVGTSLMAYHFVRARASHGWAVGAALVVGVHPSLITYEAHLLRELPSAAIMMAVSLGILTIRDRLGKGLGVAWGWTLSLALLCAAGAATRENLQILAFIVPLVLLLPGAGTLRRRAVPAVVVCVVSALIVLPGVLSIRRVYGNLSLVRPKIHYNRLLAAQGNRAHDANFAEFFTKEQWLTFRNEHLKRALVDNDLSALLNRSKLATDARFTGPNKGDQQQRAFMEEATAREPLAFYRASVRAFVSQLGLWNIQTGAMKPVAPSDEYYSRALRGEPIAAPTNFPSDTVVAVNNARLKPRKDRLLFLVADNRRGIDHLEDQPLTRLFNEWFYTSRALRPFAGWLFLVGVGLAVYRRDVSLAAVGGIVLLSTFAAAFVVGTPTDRFGVPFIPVIWCVALIALSQLLRRGARP